MTSYNLNRFTLADAKALVGKAADITYICQVTSIRDRQAGS
jgi:hypothetical protein